eukprot:TRINITY_DN4344_c0_g3_i4.p1 TRINITY_DN4344_c0_g3~~TRINITY_DN4344_c0_g3_i4.p1  ORF type:complete len:138 (+),score=20.96 TRINITY_DN4344_c0_g3_i4:43-456(+)
MYKNAGMRMLQMCLHRGMATIPKQQFISSISEKKAKEHVKARIFEVVQEIGKANKSHLNNYSTWAELGLNEIDSIELVCLLEDCFGTNITEKEASEIKSVSDAVSIFSYYYLKNALKLHNIQAVSYTHLTLPTICSV